jgi:Putative beta-barrel porin 2
MRSHFLVILTFAMVFFHLQESGRAQSSAPSLNLTSGPPAFDIGPLIGQLTLQPMNPATGATGGPLNPTAIVPSDTGLNNPGNPIPTPANELLPISGNNVVETLSQKLWRLVFTFGAGMYYDDNLFITQSNRQSDTVFTIDGGAAFELGDYRNQLDNYLITNYLVTGSFFSRHSNENNADQDFSLQGKYRFSSFTLDSNIYYEYLNGPDRLIGNGLFISHQTIDGRMRLTYNLTPKTQLYGEFEQMTELYKNFLDSFEYTGRFGIDYQITGKILVGVQGVIGTLEQQGGLSSTYLQARLHAGYQLTEKLAFDATVGAEYREYSNGGQPALDPVFTLGLIYRPFFDTTFSLTAYRTEFASPLFQGEDFIGTGVSLTISQKFVDRFKASVASGYERDSYTSTTANTPTTNREDDYLFFRPSLSYNFRSWLTGTVYYQYSRDSSSQSGSSFYDNRVGGQISIFF